MAYLAFQMVYKVVQAERDGGVFRQLKDSVHFPGEENHNVCQVPHSLRQWQLQGSSEVKSTACIILLDGLLFWTVLPGLPPTRHRTFWSLLSRISGLQETRGNKLNTCVHTSHSQTGTECSRSDILEFQKSFTLRPSAVTTVYV